MPSVPVEALPHLALVRALGVTLRRRDLLRDIAADGHFLPGHVRQIAALAGDVGAGEGVIHAGDLDDRPSKALTRDGRIHLFDNQLVGHVDNIQSANDNLLDIAARAASIRIFIYLAVTPGTLSSKVKDILHTVPEGIMALLGLVDIGETCSLQGVIHIHQFLRAGHDRIAHGAGLVPPDDSLHPGVHVPGVPGVPDIIHAGSNSHVREFAK